MKFAGTRCQPAKLVDIGGPGESGMRWMDSPINKEQFRKVMSRFATGVAIVTSRSGDQIHGMTCNAFCSISISPLSVLISLAKGTRTEKMVGAGRVFAVNILSESQTWLSDRFAGRHPNREEDRFEGVEWTTVTTGAPILKGSQAYLDCRLLNTFDCETHTLFLGSVVAIQADESQRPLLFFQSKYMGLDSLKSL
jgi:flavin reductase (DIM6/NTAB) family NADH-FMN oxidoreductase RutF